MSAFDATIRVIEADVEVIETDGNLYEQQLLLITGALAPVGNNQAIQVPLGVLRIPLDYDSTQKLISKLSAADLKRRPDIQVASEIPSGIQLPGS
jgi:hypothetical protein